MTPSNAELREIDFWNFDRRIRKVLKAHGYHPNNDLVTSIHMAAKQFYGDTGQETPPLCNIYEDEPRVYGIL